MLLLSEALAPRGTWGTLMACLVFSGAPLVAVRWHGTVPPDTLT